MRNFLTKDLGWKLFSLALAAGIWFTVQESWASRTFKDVSVLVVSASANVREFKVYPALVQVTVSGRPEVVTALKQEEIHVTADLTVIEDARDLNKRVDVSVPPGLTVVRVSPSEVGVIVPPKPEP